MSAETLRRKLELVRPRIGLALGSGAARGWSHIGIIEALADAGIEPDIVCGCSIGALVGARNVAGRLQALKDFAQSLTMREIARMLDVRLSGGGLIAGREIVAFLRKLNISGPISKHAKPFAAVATDLQTGREIWLREGPIEEAVRAWPGVVLVPRLRHIGLMEFNRADETIAEGHAVVDHALPLLRRYV